MKIASNKIKDILRYFREELQDVYSKDELESIIAYCFEYYLKLNRAELVSKADQTISESELLKLNFAIKDLKIQKPIQYILGEADFYQLKFKVNEHVLIPRPETEELVYLIINDTKKNAESLSILDIGTGSGCIPIALKKNILSAKVTAMDVSADALEVAKQNANQNGVEIEFVCDSILNPTSHLSHLSFHFDIIVSNPPYISVSEKAGMDKNVVAFEPHLALFVENDNPLLFYEVICNFALKALKKKGIIYLEINQRLGPETKNLLENKGFKNVELIKDLSNNYRILRGNI